MATISKSDIHKNNIKNAINRNLSKLEIENRIQENMGLIHMVLNKYSLASNGNWDDAYSYALEGLWEAVMYFDESKGYRFSTFATKWIEIRVRKYFGDLYKELKASSETTYLNAPINNNNNDETNKCLIDTLADDKNIEDVVILKDNMSHLYELIDEVIEQLKEGKKNKQKIIVLERWKQNPYISDKALAKELNVKTSTVTQILNVLMRLLRRKVTSEQIVNREL